MIILKKYLKKGKINIRKKLKILLFIFFCCLLTFCYNYYIKADNSSFNVSICRVDGKDILTDSTNKPFYFSATSTYDIVYMEYLGPHETVWKEYQEGTIIDENWENGKYTFMAYDEYGNNKGCHIYYDTIKPVGKIYSLNEELLNGSSVEKEYIYFEITDELSGLDMVYVKKPNSNVYTEYIRNTYLYEAGTYYFYASDYAGNISKTYTITLNGKPMVDIIYNNQNNTVYLTWSQIDYLVFVNDSPYIKEDVFYDEGPYDVLVIDGSGRRGEETFIIDHMYQYLKTISPSCSQEGYELYQCITCNLEIEKINKDKLPHDFIYSVVSPTCTDNGYQIKKCNMCNYEEKTITTNPTGHSLIEENISATCISDGGRVKRCKNCSYLEFIEKINATGHAYQSEIIDTATCEKDGLRSFICYNCGDTYQININKIGHNYILIDEKITKNKDLDIKEIITKCHNCGDIKKEYQEINKNDDNQLNEILKSNLSYLVILLISLSGIWSIYMGIKYMTAKKRSEVIEAKKYIINYIIGLIVIFSIIMLGPLLIKGIKAIL